MLLGGRGYFEREIFSYKSCSSITEESWCEVHFVGIYLLKCYDTRRFKKKRKKSKTKSKDWNIRRFNSQFFFFFWKTDLSIFYTDDTEFQCQYLTWNHVHILSGKYHSRVNDIPEPLSSIDQLTNCKWIYFELQIFAIALDQYYWYVINALTEFSY